MISKFPTTWSGGGTETVCGRGSKHENSCNFRKFLKKLLTDYCIESITDLGCGDGNIYRGLDLSEYNYIGYDIVERPTHPYKTEVKNICDTSSVFANADLFICRDVMFHLPNELCLNIISNIRKTNPFKLLLATTFKEVSNLNRIEEPSQGFSPINLEVDPFDLGLAHSYAKDYNNVYLGLWSL